MTTELMEQRNGLALGIGAQALIDRAARIQDVLKRVMRKGIDYGTIPGCGDKPGLLKPGAEKILSTFELGAVPQQAHVLDLGLVGMVRVRVIVPIVHIPTGRIVGHGIGECSSEEDKYAWKRAVCEDEWNESDPEQRREKWKAGKTQPYKIKQVRTNPADVANTVLKMAKKRAVVDGTLTATACSDMFEQGEDVTGDEDEGFHREAAHRERTAMHEQPSAHGPVLPKYLGEHAGKALTDPTVSVETLTDCATRLEAALTKGYPPARQRFEAGDRALAAALHREIQRRHAAPGTAPGPYDDTDAWQQTCDEMERDTLRWKRTKDTLQIATPRELKSADREAFVLGYRQAGK